jgi:hypothetical protein
MRTYFLNLYEVFEIIRNFNNYQGNQWVIGFNPLKAQEFRGCLNNFTSMLVFKLVKWLGLSIGEQSFSIVTDF